MPMAAAHKHIGNSAGLAAGSPRVTLSESCVLSVLVGEQKKPTVFKVIVTVSESCETCTGCHLRLCDFVTL
jgi:hypothetical protein